MFMLPLEGKPNKLLTERKPRTCFGVSNKKSKNDAQSNTLLTSVSLKEFGCIKHIRAIGPHRHVTTAILPS
jgi:hypothetical protein